GQPPGRHSGDLPAGTVEIARQAGSLKDAMGTAPHAVVAVPARGCRRSQRTPPPVVRALDVRRRCRTASGGDARPRAVRTRSRGSHCSLDLVPAMASRVLSPHLPRTSEKRADGAALAWGEELFQLPYGRPLGDTEFPAVYLEHLRAGQPPGIE